MAGSAKKPGRPRIYANKAEKDAAYRARKTRSTGALQIGLWLSAEAHVRLHERAAQWGCTLGEAMSRLVLAYDALEPPAGKLEE
jgi:hypothetical protein